MARTPALALAALALCVIATVAASPDASDARPDVAEDARQGGEKTPSVNSLDSQAEAEKETAEEDVRDAKLLAYFSTTTLTSIMTSTKLALSTCWSTSDKACTGKRKRRAAFSPRDLSVRQLTARDLELDGSLDAEAAVLPLDDGSSGRSGRKLTIWSTGYTTVTITTTSYYAGTTVSVSAVCTVSGDAQSCFG